MSHRLPAPPASGLGRIVVILAVYGACVTVISIVGMIMAAVMFWLIGSSPIRSSAGLVIYTIGMVAFLWPVLYLIGELDRWRKRRASFR